MCYLLGHTLHETVSHALAEVIPLMISNALAIPLNQGGLLNTNKYILNIHKCSFWIHKFIIGIDETLVSTLTRSLTHSITSTLTFSLSTTPQTKVRYRIYYYNSYITILFYHNFRVNVMLVNIMEEGVKNARIMVEVVQGNFQYISFSIHFVVM